QVARELGFTLPASAYVFSREPDGSRPLAPTLVSHQFAALARSLGVRCRLHDLRHLMVTYLISQGVDWGAARGARLPPPPPPHAAVDHTPPPPPPGPRPRRAARHPLRRPAESHAVIGTAACAILV